MTENTEDLNEILSSIREVLEKHTESLKLISNKFEEYDEMFSDLSNQLVNVSRHTMNNMNSLKSCLQDSIKVTKDINTLYEKINNLHNDSTAINEHILSIYDLLKTK